MATSRPFAYNPGAPILGTTQVGTLAVGTPTSGFTNSPQFWNGPDEDLGYVIAAPQSGNTQPTPISGVTASIGFFRTNDFTDNSFIILAQYVSNEYGTPQIFSSGNDASTWLTANGYWNSWIFLTPTPTPTPSITPTNTITPSVTPTNTITPTKTVTPTPTPTRPFIAGLYKTTYSGYFNDNVSFFATATPASVGGNPATSVQTTSIFEPAQDDGSNFSCQWLGYFKPTTTETYTFFTSSDDASYVWVGANAQTGFSTTNSTVNNGGLHGNLEKSGTISLTAGVYYPIRIQFGELSGGDVMTFSFSTSSITKTTNVTGLVFYNPQTNGF